MAQHKSAEKRTRAAVGRTLRNAALESRMRTAIKHVHSIKEKEKAQAELRKTVKLLDQLAAKGVIHRNKAANAKSRLTLYVNGLK